MNTYTCSVGADLPGLPSTCWQYDTYTPALSSPSLPVRPVPRAPTAACSALVQCLPIVFLRLTCIHRSSFGCPCPLPTHLIALYLPRTFVWPPRRAASQVAVTVTKMSHLHSLHGDFGCCGLASRLGGTSQQPQQGPAHVQLSLAVSPLRSGRFRAPGCKTRSMLCVFSRPRSLGEEPLSPTGGLACQIPKTPSKCTHTFTTNVCPS